MIGRKKQASASQFRSLIRVIFLFYTEDRSMYHVVDGIEP